MNYKIRTYKIAGDHWAAVRLELEKHIGEQPIADVFKQAILNKDFIEQNPNYYIDYPYLFADIFENSDTQQLDLLSVAGFLYYKATILLDRVLDKQINFQEVMPLINICQEECVKILSMFFPPSSPYWAYWNRRKMEFLKAFSIDSSTHAVSDFADFENLADWKSAFGKLAIDALFVMSSQTDEANYQAIIHSHRYFYCAFQILDDISDFREDLRNGQFNIGFWALKKELKSEQETDIDTLAKYLHLTGISIDLIKKALHYLEKALKEIENHNLHCWKKEICKLWNTAVIQTLTIEGYIKTLEVEEKLSGTIQVQKSAEKSCEKGLDFVFSLQNQNGSWNEFCNNAGLSDVWATAFISLFINDLIISEKQKNQFKNARNFLIENKSAELWGYNKMWIDDNDSSVFALLALKNDVDILQYISILQQRQNIDGGFATYFDRQALKSSLNSPNNEDINVAGWLQSHLCVSSAALYLLSLQNQNSPHFAKLLSFVKSQFVDNQWKPYWWIDSIYCLYFVSKAAENINDLELRRQIETCIAATIQRQNANGSFADNNVLLTSLMVKLLANNELYFSKYQQETTNAVDWLLANQFSDGSWRSSCAMAMPGADNVTPLASEKWKISTRGVNIRANDFSRLFSTSVAVSALNSYAKKQ